MIFSILSIVITFCSFVGWGWLISYTFKLKSSPGIGLFAGWGMALLAVFGGFLNLGAIISNLTVSLLLCIGLALFIIHFYTKRNTIKDWFLSIHLTQWQTYGYAGLFLLLAIFIILFFLSANGHLFNEHDDFHAYLVYPYKMLQTGAIGLEPFNERRLGVYGGLSFLQSIIIGVFKIHQPHLMGTGVSWLILISLMLGHGRQNKSFIFIIIALLCHFINIPSENNSSLLSGSTLFFTLFRSYNFLQKESLLTKIIILSISAAGLCSLKNSFIPACGLVLFFLILFAIDKATPLKHRIGEAISTGMFTIFLLLPWMISMYQSNDTFLYPLLGCGIHGSSYSSFPAYNYSILNSFIINYGMRHLFIKDPFLLSIILLILSSLKKGKDSLRFKTGLFIFLGSWSVVFLLYIISGGISRYSFPISFAVVMFQLTDYFFQEKPVQDQRPASDLTRFNFLLLIISFLLIYGTFGIINWKREWKSFTNPRSAWNDKYVNQIRKAQNKVPKGAILLARVSRPYLLDFSRNQIFTIDWPGGSGPAPGLPCFGKPRELIDYLKQNNVRYIIYSYGDESGHPRKKYLKRLKFPDLFYLDRVKKLAEYSFAFQDRLSELKNNYKNLYLDKRFVVIDISEPKNS